MDQKNIYGLNDYLYIIIIVIPDIFAVILGSAWIKLGVCETISKKGER